MRLIFIILVSLFLVSCVTTRRNNMFPPEYQKFEEIYKEEYIKHEYDCSNKSSKYCSYLRKKGYTANIIVTFWHNEAHAVVQVAIGDDYLYCDPANGTWSKDISDYGSITHFIAYEKITPEFWGGEFTY